VSTPGAALSVSAAMQTAFHHVLFAEGAATPPEWVHLIPAGTFSGVDGRGPWKLADAQAVIAASMADGDLLIDESHATDLAPTTGVAAPARAWIKELQAHDDGIWGRCDWSETGKQLMSERAYRGVSPVFVADKKGVVLRILRAALTNTPNLTQLASLNSEEHGMDLTRLREALGLAETADEAAILTAVTASVATVTRHSQQLSAIAAAAGLDAALAPDGLVVALQAQRAGATDAQQLAGQVVTLQTQLSTLQAERGRERAVAFVDGAIKAGKPISPLRDHFVTRHMADAAAVELEIGKLPSINAGGVPDDDAPTASEKATAEKMGLDPKKLVAQRKKREAGDGGTA
jgi:phage I-like protein